MNRLSILLLLCLVFPVTVADPEPGASFAEVRLDAPRGRLRLAALGDLHGVVSDELVGALRAAHEEDPFDAVLVMGDNFEAGVTSEEDPLWDEVITRLAVLGVTLFPVLGNHDYGNPKQRFHGITVEGSPNPAAQVAYRENGWVFPSRNYVISTPLGEILMIDSTPLALNLERGLLGSSTAGEVIAFATERLKRPTTGWRIVAAHHNVEQSGKKRFRSRHTLRNMTRFGAMLDELGTDLFVSGHQHHLELYQFGSTTHLISGLAGPRPKRAARLHPPQESAQFLATVERSAAAFAILDIRPETLRITFHDNRRTFDGEHHSLASRRSASAPLVGGR